MTVVEGGGRTAIRFGDVGVGVIRMEVRCGVLKRLVEARPERNSNWEVNLTWIRSDLLYEEVPGG